MKDEIEIRPASVVDAEALVALERALADDGRGMVLTSDQVRNVDETRARIDAGYQLMSAGSATLWLVALLAGELSGTANLLQLVPAHCSHVGVLSLGVHPRAQRRGIGRALLRELIDHAQGYALERLELYVRSDNTRAHLLYESEGFVLEGVRTRFVKLEDGSYVDDLVMVRFLTV